MPRIHETWAARVLGMELNPSGPDLIDAKKAMEVKFTLVGSECKADKYPKAWTVIEYQMDYSNGRNIYWGLGTYELDMPVSKIKTKNPNKLSMFH